MKNHPAFELRSFMYVYNFLQVIFCAYVTYEVGRVNRKMREFVFILSSRQRMYGSTIDTIFSVNLLIIPIEKFLFE